jgi:oligopeptide/dipeptide ABC transporter ATP-binding protein
MPLLEINNFTLDFAAQGSLVRVVDRLTLSVDPGETVCLVGESGCGKSVTALSIMRLLSTPPAHYSGGEILFQGRDTLKLSPHELREVRGRGVGYIFQEPAASLNPVRRVGRQLRETLKLHQADRAEERDAIELLQMVRIAAPELRIRDYPFQMSGGMQQRVMLALALASKPQLLVADEPTTALDVTIQAQILELLKDLRNRFRMGILLITHNLGLVSEMADRVAVMYAGHIVELAPARVLLAEPLHPYTRALMRSVPRLGSSVARLSSIPGSVPRPGAWPVGCRFEPRCPLRQPACSTAVPELVEVDEGHSVRCPFWQGAPSTKRA